MLTALYRHARNEDGKRSLFENDPSFPKGWVNLDSVAARELIAPFVPLDDADDMKKARRFAQANLEAQAWNDLLGIDEPPIACKIKIHGNKWGLRFQSMEPALRGREVINEDLPPMRCDGGRDPAAQAIASLPINVPIVTGTTTAAEAPIANTSPGTLANDAGEILKKAGMPA